MFLLSILFCFLSSSYGDESSLDLATRFAPIVYQKAGWNALADQPTRVDFDGDWFSDNNWKNTRRFERPLTVYYDVFETRSHWYIFYQFFYPQDNQFICWFGGCHENDLEDIQVIVEKNPERLVYVETSAHGKRTINDRFQLKKLETNQHPTHPVVVSNAGSHAFRVWKGTSDIVWPKYELTPAEFSDSTDSLDGKFHYELRSLQELWAHKNEVGPGRLWFEERESRGRRYYLPAIPTKMAGKKWKDFAANPLWSHDEAFFDPALTLWEYLGEPEGFSLDYLRNPYW